MFLFTYLKKQQMGGWVEISSAGSVPKCLTAAKNDRGWNQEPGTPARSPPRVAGPKHPDWHPLPHRRHQQEAACEEASDTGHRCPI